MKEHNYPEGSFTCECGNTIHMYWNGGELDQETCKCGRKYYGEHRVVVMIQLEPGERDTRFE